MRLAETTLSPRAVEPLGEFDDQAFGSADVLETDDPIDPLAAEHPGLAAVEADQRKEPDRLVEVLDDKTDVDEAGYAGTMAVQ